MSETQTKVVLGFSVSAAVLLCMLTAILTVAVIGVGLVHVLPTATPQPRPRLFPQLAEPPQPQPPQVPRRPVGNAADIGPLNTEATDEVKRATWFDFPQTQSAHYCTWQEAPAR